MNIASDEAITMQPIVDPIIASTLNVQIARGGISDDELSIDFGLDLDLDLQMGNINTQD